MELAPVVRGGAPMVPASPRPGPEPRARRAVAWGGWLRRRCLGIAEAAVRFEQGQTVLRERNNAQVKFTNGEIRECCKDTRNLVQHGPRYDITVYVCKVCQRKHRRMWAEPGSLGLIPGRVG